MSGLGINLHGNGGGLNYSETRDWLLKDTDFLARIDKGSISDFAVRFKPNQVFDAGFTDNNLSFGNFFEVGADLGKCFWRFQFAVSPAHTTGYFVVGSDGGSHPVLGGVQSAGGGRFRLTGNMFNGVSNLTVTGIDTFGANEIHEGAIGFDESFMYLYLDGVLTGITAWTGTRQAGALSTDGDLFAGASGGHAGCDGWLFRLQGFETVIPFTTFPSAYHAVKIYPDCWNIGGNFVPSVFNIDVTRPTNKIVDTSAGYRGSSHSGYRALERGLQSNESRIPQFEPFPYVLPSFAGSAGAIPPNCYFFDDFKNRDNETFFTSVGDSASFPFLGVARTGQTWEGTSGSIPTQPEAGIIEGAMCSLSASQANGVHAYVPIANPNNRMVINTRGSFGCAPIIRRTDANNFIQVAATKTSLVFVRTAGGVQTFVGGGAISNTSWTQIEVISNGGNITANVGGSSFPLVEATLLTGNRFGVGVANVQHIEDITVFSL